MVNEQGVGGRATVGLETVFKIGGVPTVTFVRPSRWGTLLTNLRTPGRGLVVEGPSGIGKTTAVKRALAELGREEDAQYLSARRPSDVELIELLPSTDNFGLVVVDDFHVLEDSLRGDLADLLKALADAEDATSKLVVIGINRAGDRLIEHAPDLVNRLDVLRFDVEPQQKISEMISLGEKALNVEINARDYVVESAHGSFYLAQLLCHEICSNANVFETVGQLERVTTPFSRVKQIVLERQEIRFDKVLTKFARGNKFRPGGRAPYVTVLKWLRESDAWTISLPEAMRLHPSARASVSVVLKNGYLENLVSDPDIAKILHFDSVTNVLSLEDPQVAFYIRNLDIVAWVRKIGFRNVDLDISYDVALSFAGEDRDFAVALKEQLEERGLIVFYDHNEQARILGEDLEQFFRPIYQAGAGYIVVLLGPTYGQKRWTRFESDAFKERFDQGRVIPVWSTLVPETIWDKSRTRGGCTFDPNDDTLKQASEIAELISHKIDEN
ncbi:TIR domain-containing protein [Streptomyces violaceorubidus]|uniref:TIR domain-containing protein n=1 Tax=Streptomyces violaceorubidus TaxID=284042 RepID=A0ABV1T346_9ACTN